MQTSDLVLVRGLADTRATLEAWNERPGPVIGRWTAAALAIALALLGAVWIVAGASAPDISQRFLGFFPDPDLGHVLHVLMRDGLVLALHGFACIAGFIAGSCLPQEAQRYSCVALDPRQGGTVRDLLRRGGDGVLAHDAGLRPRPGRGDAGVAAGSHPGMLLLGLLPHALPELVALFLPLAAWMMASREQNWHELLAATIVTVLLAIPVLVAAAFVEVYVSQACCARSPGKAYAPDRRIADTSFCIVARASTSPKETPQWPDRSST